jgi:hypothetical protein
MGEETMSAAKGRWVPMPPEKPQVGQGATMGIGSDRYPGTVVETYERGAYFYVVIQDDTATMKPGCSIFEHQAWDYSRNPLGNKHIFRFTRPDPNKEAGKWEHVYLNSKNRMCLAKTYRLSLTGRDKYVDPSF